MAREAEWAPATRNRYLALLKLTYRLAEEDGVIKLNPVRLVRQAKEDNSRVRYLLDSEETALRAVIAKSYSDHLPEVEIALMTGMRQGEQFGLTWDKVDLNSGTLRLEKTKNGNGRFVRLNTRALTVMRALHDFGFGTGRVFVLNKKPRWFADAVEDAGVVDFTWHDLRHLRTVMELMGHKSITMTMRYAHLSPQHRAAALEKLCVPSATTTATEAHSASATVAHGVN